MDEIINKCVDFNCDITNLDFANNNDFDLLDYVSSVNIPCGIHAGNPVDIKHVIEHCKFKNKVIGASIGFPLTNRKTAKKSISYENLSYDEIEALVLYQLGALVSFAKANSLVIEYVRPSGLMYELAAKNLDFSVSLAKAIKKYSDWLIYYGASTDILKEASESVSINYAAEVFVDKNYDNEGLPVFDDKNTLDVQISLMRLRKLLNLSEIELADGSYKKLDFDTIHFCSMTDNIKDFLKESSKLVTPHPVNYNKAVPSGWV